MKVQTQSANALDITFSTSVLGILLPLFLLLAVTSVSSTILLYKYRPNIFSLSFYLFFTLVSASVSVFESS